MINTEINLIEPEDRASPFPPSLMERVTELLKEEISKLFCVCPTEDINRHYSKDGLVPENCCFNEWNEDWCKNLCKRLMKINANKKPSEMQHVLLILDDIYCDTDFHHSPMLKSIFMRSRHYGLSIISLVQTLHSLPPFARINSDWVIAGQVNRQSIQLMADEFLAGDLGKPEFINLYNRTTMDYGFLVINNNSIKDSDDLNQIYGQVKVPNEYV